MHCFIPVLAHEHVQLLHVMSEDEKDWRQEECSLCQEVAHRDPLTPFVSIVCQVFFEPIGKVDKRANAVKGITSDFSASVTRGECHGSRFRSSVCAWSTPTWKLLISLHPSDGGGGLTAHGSAGHLCFVALAQDLIPRLDDGVTWRNCDRTHKPGSVNSAKRRRRNSTHLCLHAEKTDPQPFHGNKKGTDDLLILYNDWHAPFPLLC